MASSKKAAPAKRAATKKAAKKAPSKKTVAQRARNTPAKASARKVTVKAKHAMQRADFGAPIEGFFGKQPPALRAVLETLRGLVEAAMPDAQAAIKWGMPVYSVGSKMVCSLGAHKAHVNLVLVGPAAAFDDPEGRLEGTGKAGRHLKLTSVDQIPTAQVRRWLRIAAEHART